MLSHHTAYNIKLEEQHRNGEARTNIYTHSELLGPKRLIRVVIINETPRRGK